ncbi:MAG: hypothetical protein JW735_13330 [Prolixibacteraceae bacterium]|jgi:hypothetical protein|nr:hypothetical protein [Prolixibacteraceae bacterium]
MKKIITSFLICISLFCYAQKENKSPTFKISYFGEMITHPGLKFGVEHQLFLKESRKKQKEIKHQIISCLNIGGYTHFKFNTNLFLNTEIGYRHTCSGGFIYETMIGIGYLRTFINGKTYTVTNNGSISEIFLAGSNSFMPSFSLGFGADVKNKNNCIKAWYIKPVLFLQMPYNSSILPHLAIETGINFQLNK